MVANAQAVSAGSLDAKGAPYDPSKHIAKQNSKTGRWMPRGGRRPFNVAAAVGAVRDPMAVDPAPESIPSESIAPEVAPNFDDIEKAARDPNAPQAPKVSDTPTAETCIGIIQTALIVIGDEEGVLSEGEKELLRGPLKRVIDKYNIGAKMMPAEIDLAFAVASLIVIRLQRPKTATWFAKAKAWFVGFFFRRQGSALANTVRKEVNMQPATAGQS